MTITANRLTRARIVGGSEGRPVFSTRLARLAAQANYIPRVVRWSFLLFVATLPFEAANLAFTTKYVSLAKVSGLFFLGCYLLYYNPFSTKRSLPRLSHALWWFLGYLAIYTSYGFFIPEDSLGTFFRRIFTLVQLMGFLCIASTLLKDGKMARNFVLTYSIATAILAFGTLLRLPGFSVQMGARVTALGVGPNFLAITMALAVVMLIGLCLNVTFKYSWARISLMALTLPLLVMIVSTGSRSGIVTLMIGLFVYLLPYCRSRRKITAAIMVALGIAGTVYMVASRPDSLERWRETFYEGRLSGREELFSIAIDMILEKPIFGWKPVESFYEFGFRRGRWRKTGSHNLVLHLLTEGGLVGAIPFFVGLWLCVRAAWRGRTGTMGTLPLATLLTVLAGTLAIPMLTHKIVWLMLALALAAAPRVSYNFRMRHATAPTQRRVEPSGVEA